MRHFPVLLSRTIFNASYIGNPSPFPFISSSFIFRRISSAGLFAVRWSAKAICCLVGVTVVLLGSCSFQDPVVAGISVEPIGWRLVRILLLTGRLARRRLASS